MIITIITMNLKNKLIYCIIFLAKQLLLLAYCQLNISYCTAITIIINFYDINLSQHNIEAKNGENVLKNF